MLSLWEEVHQWQLLEQLCHWRQPWQQLSAWTLEPGCPDSSPSSTHAQAARPCMCYFCKIQYDDEKQQLQGENEQCT